MNRTYQPLEDFEDNFASFIEVASYAVLNKHMQDKILDSYLFDLRCTCATCFKTLEHIQDALGRDVATIVQEYLLTPYCEATPEQEILFRTSLYGPYLTISRVYYHFPVFHESDYLLSGIPSNEYVAARGYFTGCHEILQAANLNDVYTDNIAAEELDEVALDMVNELELLVYEETIVLTKDQQALKVTVIFDPNHPLSYY